MMLNLLAVMDPTRSATIGEAALYAFLGYLIVFLGIAFLIFVVWGVGKLMTFMDGKKKAKPVQKTQESAVAPVAVDSDEISDEVIAVITAAIAAYYQQENKKCEFTVKRIKRL